MSEPPPAVPVIPEFRAVQRWNMVWVVPILAVLIGGWLVYQNLASRGPTAQVRFETADGIAAGKTEVRCRSVRVGMVKDLELASDLKSVLVYIQMDRHAATLLCDDTRFWVVRPRVSATDISGLGTLLTGAYIEVEPGSGSPGPTAFRGLEEPPPTNRNVPGLRLVLTADEAGSLAVGSPIYYLGVEVGRIEKRELAPNKRQVYYHAFVRKEFSSLVWENTRFWNTSGVDISAGATGIKVRTPSFQAMLSGGASFGIPEGLDPSKPATDNTVFKLYPDREEAQSSLFDPSLKVLLLFDQSVRGLTKGATVEFRGIPIGRVVNVSFDYLPSGKDSRVPVLVEMDPALLRRSMQGQVAGPNAEFLKQAVEQGLRAGLKIQSYITGTLFVDFAYYPDAAVAAVSQVGEFTTVPTLPNGLAQLEMKVTAILDKIQALPLDEVVGNIGKAAAESATTLTAARTTLAEINVTAAAARHMLDDPQLRGVPADLRRTLSDLQKTIASVGPDGSMQGDLLRTLDELRASLRSIKGLSTTLDDKPNSLLFGRDSSGNAQPRAPRTKH
ncbi:MAG: intermembrane transport protein PqiB [Verrucomicrobia bacterium]|nr:MAG: intermembrane transport protein PqiB [Verrucomicrobiota bacterium]